MTIKYMEGWIKLYRQFIEWEWFTRAEMVQLFLYFLIKANHEPAKWRGIDIKQGQFITSLDRISRETGLSVQTIRTSINRLKSTNEITVESTNRNTMITICNYSIYQDQKAEDNKQNNIPSNRQLTSEQQTTNKQLTTNKNEKNNKNNKNYLQSKDCPNSEEESLEEKPKKKSTRNKKAEPSDKDTQLNIEARKIFEARYLRETREKYYWTGKDGGNMTKILNALKYQRTEKGLSNDNNTDILAALTMFINMSVKDEWIKKNFSVAILFTKFNEIVARAKAEEQKRKSVGNYGDK